MHAQPVKQERKSGFIILSGACDDDDDEVTAAPVRLGLVAYPSRYEVDRTRTRTPPCACPSAPHRRIQPDRAGVHPSS